MRILITGSNGYIGSNLEDYFREKQDLYLCDLTDSKRAHFFPCDISDFKKVKKLIDLVEPDTIIHTAGLSSLAGCEENKRASYLSNVVGTRNIIKSILKINPKIKLVFMSSDYVFDGKKGDYKEGDIAKPQTYYGKNKLKSEKDVIKHLKNYIIIRSANVFGRGGKFFNFLVSNLEQGTEAEYFDNTFYTPTPVDFLLKGIEELLEKNFVGTIHLAGKERVSRYEFAHRVAEALGKSKKLIKPSKRKRGKLSLISLDSSLNTDFMSSILTSPCPELKEYISHYVAGSKK